jgi:hypothetical protein
VEIEEWNEYGELKQHVKIYYDDFTIPPISQAPKTAPTPAPAPAAAAASTTAKPAAVPVAPPLPATSAGAAGADASKSTEQAKQIDGTPAVKTALPIRSIADEAAQKAKELRLQSLRDKVYGKKGGEKKEDASEAKESDKAASPENDKNKETKETKSIPAPVSIESTTAAGLQSPTSGAWKDTTPTDALLTIQSPTSTSWRPTDIDGPIKSHMGSVIASASAEEIKAIEQASAIKEEPEAEEEAEAEDDDDDDDSEESDDSEEEEKKPAAKEEKK